MEIRVSSEDIKVRIDKFLAERMEESRSEIDKMIDDEFILVNNEVVKSNYIVKENDVILIKDGFHVEDSFEPENIPLDIVYEDNDIIIVNKPSGMVVHPGNGNTSGTLANALMYHTKNLSDINGDVRPGIVHRIDKDTSGLMIVAKNNKAHEILTDMLSRHEIKREYLALLIGEFKSDTATIDAPIGRDQVDRKKMAVTDVNSKDAITHLRVVKRYKGYTLVRLSLETGRTHQIRVHMAYIGYPVFNDPVYTKNKTTEFGQFLHSTSITLNHPITGENIHFEVDVPDTFKDYLEGLEEL